MGFRVEFVLRFFLERKFFLAKQNPHAARFIDCIAALDRVLGPSSPWTADSAGLRDLIRRYPLRVPRDYLAAADPLDLNDPLLGTCIPRAAELCEDDSLSSDPLAEEQHTVVPRLIHRYPDRVLLLATEACAVYCRFCTRKRLVGQRGDSGISPPELESVRDYLRAHPEVREVVISGGDPLVLDDDQLGRILATLREITTVRLLRIHTRVPVVLPARVTPRLAASLARHGPLFVMVHAAHPRELTAPAERALARLADAGIPLGSQTVLLRGLNDDERVLRTLFERLLTLRVRPYYLHQCDLSAGTAHFRTPLLRGPELIAALRGTVSGMGIPTFVVDLPGGHGKAALAPENIVARRREGNLTVFKLASPRGVEVDYPDTDLETS